jgi:hypothetical protein
MTSIGTYVSGLFSWISPSPEKFVRKGCWECQPAIFRTVYIKKNLSLGKYVEDPEHQHATNYVKENKLHFLLYSLPRDLLKRAIEVKDQLEEYKEVDIGSEDYYQLFPDNELIGKLESKMIQNWVNEGKFDPKRWERIREACYQFDDEKAEKEKIANTQFLLENAQASFSELLGKKRLFHLLDLYTLDRLKSLFNAEFGDKEPLEIIKALPKFDEIIIHAAGRNIVGYDRFIPLHKFKLERDGKIEKWSFSPNEFSLKSGEGESMHSWS